MLSSARDKALLVGVLVCNLDGALKSSRLEVAVRTKGLEVRNLTRASYQMKTAKAMLWVRLRVFARELESIDAQ